MESSLDTVTRVGARGVLTLEEIFSLVGREIELVEREFDRQISAAPEIISTIGRYLREAGGKRLRPTLLLLACKLVRGESNPSSIRMASVMEMLHTATLVHDDIIDHANVRRGRASVNAKWGNDITVLIGDWLYMTAFDITLSERDFDIIDLLTDVTRLMTEGEIIQFTLVGNSHTNEAQHLDIVRRKTAYMFSACTEVGGIVAGATCEERRTLAHYGESLGIAFQLIDDVLDFVSTEDKLGKPVASDLREGKLTLPIIYLLDNGEKEHREMIETIVREHGFVSVTREDVLKALVRYQALDYAKGEARRYANEAIEAAALFKPSQFRDALMSIPGYIIEREM